MSYGFARRTQSEFHELRGDYLAAKRSTTMRRRRRGVPTMGASADYHYLSEADFLWMMEMAREFDRNDLVVGQTVDRAVANELQDGFTPEPNTGDKGLDKYLIARWNEESIEADLCDVAGEQIWHEQTELVSRAVKVDGDILPVPTVEGPVQLVEGHRCRSPHRTAKNVVHGVEMEPTRRRRRYWFTKDPIDPLDARKLLVRDFAPIDARDADGDKQVWHVYNPKRATQTRGVTAFAPIFDAIGMHDDIQFAKLLHQQIVSCFVLFRNRTLDFNPATANLQRPVGDVLPAGAGQRRVEGMVPGLELAGDPGEVLSMGSPNVPNAEFFDHVKLILQLIGINLGLPLCVVLLDASETNFSGFRGAIDQARLGFRKNQRVLIRRWCRPSWHWRVDRWSLDDSVLRKYVQKYLDDRKSRTGTRERFETKAVNPYRHEWSRPAWPYIEPTKDAAADLLQLSNMLDSPRGVAKARDRKYADVVRETIDDRGDAIVKAHRRAERINKRLKLEGDERVKWRDLAPLPMPEGVTLSVALGGDGAAGGEDAAGGGRKKPSKRKPGAGPTK